MVFDWLGPDFQDRKIGKRAKYKEGQLFKHKKHGFIVRLLCATDYNDRKLELIRGHVPKNVMERGHWYGIDNGSGSSGRFTNGCTEKDQMICIYSSCALTTVFEALGPASSVLFGES